MRVSSARVVILIDSLILGFMAFAVLFKGGKTLESTWLLAGLGAVLLFAHWWMRLRGILPQSDIPQWLWLCVFAFIGWSLVSFGLSTTQNYGLDELLRDCGLVAVFLWVIRRHAADDAWAERWMRVLTLTAMASCIAGLAVYALQPVNRFVGTFLDWRFHTDYWPNAWAEFLLLALPVSAFATRGWSAGKRALAVGLLLGALLLSYSRGALIAGAGELAVLAGILLIGGTGVIRKKTMMTAGCTAVIALSFFFGANAVRSQWFPVESVAKKITFTAAEGSSSVSERSQFWAQSFALSLERPLLGWGPYSFRFVQPRLQTAVYATSDHPHNVILKLAMERGWIAAMLWTAVIGGVLLSAAGRVLRGSGSAALPWILAGVIGVLLHNMIDYNLQFVGIALPLWISLALLAPRSDPVPRRRIFRTVEILLAILLACAVIVEGRMLVLSSLGRHAEASGNADAALRWYDASRNELFSRDLHLSRTVLLWNRGDVQGAQAALNDYFAQNKVDARAWMIAAGLGVPGAADRAYMYGKYNDLDAVAGALQSLTSEQTALRQREFETLYEAYVRAILENSHFIALSENVEKLAAVESLLAKLYPENAGRYATLLQEAEDHAEEERGVYSARAPGMLW